MTDRVIIRGSDLTNHVDTLTEGDRGMTYTVHYGRHFSRNHHDFPTFAEAVAFIEASEDRGEIYAAYIDRDGERIYDGSDPFAAPRWQPQVDDAPEWPERKA